MCFIFRFFPAMPSGAPAPGHGAVANVSPEEAKGNPTEEAVTVPFDRVNLLQLRFVKYSLLLVGRQCSAISSAEQTNQLWGGGRLCSTFVKGGGGGSPHDRITMRQFPKGGSSGLRIGEGEGFFWGVRHGVGAIMNRNNFI